MTTTFHYDNANIQDFQVEAGVTESGKQYVKSITIDDEPHKPTNRFWNSLFSNFGFSKNIFNYFRHDEVFERIAEVRNTERLRYCVEESENGDKKLLAVTNPTKPLVRYDELQEMLDVHKAHDITYSNGIVESSHTPSVGAQPFEALGDSFENRFMLSTPVDGYGMPNIYLGLLRQVCANGMVAMSKEFRSTVNLGKGTDNLGFTLTRMFEQFNNEEGFVALRDRVEAAGNSWASLQEVNSLYKLLSGIYGNRNSEAKVAGDGDALEVSPTIRRGLLNGTGGIMGADEDTAHVPILQAFHGVTGDTTDLYGLANIDAMSKKRQRTLPVNCTVYDIINFVTEVSTHHSNPQAARKLNGWVGSLITSEYDMENTKSHYDDFADFHISTKLQSGMTGSEHAVA